MGHVYHVREGNMGRPSKEGVRKVGRNDSNDDANIELLNDEAYFEDHSTTGLSPDVDMSDLVAKEDADVETKGLSDNLDEATEEIAIPRGRKLSTREKNEAVLVDTDTDDPLVYKPNRKSPRKLQQEADEVTAKELARLEAIKNERKVLDELLEDDTEEVPFQPEGRDLSEKEINAPETTYSIQNTDKIDLAELKETVNKKRGLQVGRRTQDKSLTETKPDVDEDEITEKMPGSEDTEDEPLISFDENSSPSLRKAAAELASAQIAEQIAQRRKLREEEKEFEKVDWLLERVPPSKSKIVKDYKTKKAFEGREREIAAEQARELARQEAAADRERSIELAKEQLHNVVETIASTSASWLETLKAGSKKVMSGADSVLTVLANDLDWRLEQRKKSEQEGRARRAAARAEAAKEIAHIPEIKLDGRLDAYRKAGETLTTLAATIEDKPEPAPAKQSTKEKYKLERPVPIEAIKAMAAEAGDGLSSWFRDSAMAFNPKSWWNGWSTETKYPIEDANLPEAKTAKAKLGNEVAEAVKERIKVGKLEIGSISAEVQRAQKELLISATRQREELLRHLNSSERDVQRLASELDAAMKTKEAETSDISFLRGQKARAEAKVAKLQQDIENNEFTALSAELKSEDRPDLTNELKAAKRELKDLNARIKAFESMLKPDKKLAPEVQQMIVGQLERKDVEVADKKAYIEKLDFLLKRLDSLEDRKAA